ncbi:putative MFS transporter [Rhodotorula diobovata]|uniref:Putative MFS transporter n=1 Tax=Rhodotorula diobovata TaxID=5288 RepID=A0A5C5FTQ9_9BASI|nr:putative MFS transporter [Rhodotorula diobovata]
MRALRVFASELGLHHVRDSHAPRDIILICLSRFTRLLGFGAVAPVLLIFLRAIDIPERAVGFFLTATLLGDVVLSLFVTQTADLLGRRRMLALGSALMCASGVAFYLSHSFVVLLVAAIVGIISPTGNETGPFAALEQAMLSQLTEQDGRVSLLMWYQVIGYAGMGTGSVLTSIMVSSLNRAGKPPLVAYKAIFLLYAVAAAVKIVLSLALSAHSELDHPPVPPKTTSTASTASAEGDGERQPLLQHQTASSTASAVLDPPQELPPTPTPLPIARLVVLCAIFSLDAFASSLGPGSFIAYFLRETFSAPVALIASIFSVASVTTCVSQLAAGSISKRLGVVKTMVATHIPAQLFTIALGLAPTLPLALTFLLARACIASMDASVRGAFLSAVVPRSSRTKFLGIVDVCKTLASTPGPTLSLGLASMGHIRIAFVLMGSIKIICESAWIGRCLASHASSSRARLRLCATPSSHARHRASATPR